MSRYNERSMPRSVPLFAGLLVACAMVLVAPALAWWTASSEWDNGNCNEVGPLIIAQNGRGAIDYGSTDMGLSVNAVGSYDHWHDWNDLSVSTTGPEGGNNLIQVEQYYDKMRRTIIVQGECDSSGTVTITAEWQYVDFHWISMNSGITFDREGEARCAANHTARWIEDSATFNSPDWDTGPVGTDTTWSEHATDTQDPHDLESFEVDANALWTEFYHTPNPSPPAGRFWSYIECDSAMDPTKGSGTNWTEGRMDAFYTILIEVVEP